MGSLILLNDAQPCDVGVSLWSPPVLCMNFIFTLDWQSQVAICYTRVSIIVDILRYIISWFQTGNKLQRRFSATMKYNYQLIGHMSHTTEQHFIFAVHAYCVFLMFVVNVSAQNILKEINLCTVAV